MYQLITNVVASGCPTKLELLYIVVVIALLVLVTLSKKW